MDDKESFYERKKSRCSSLEFCVKREGLLCEKGRPLAQ